MVVGSGGVGQVGRGAGEDPVSGHAIEEVGEGAALDVTGRERDCDLIVFVHRIAEVGGGDRGVVHRRYGDGHRLSPRSDGPVGDGVGKGVAAVVVGVRRVGTGGAGAGHRPICGRGRDLVAQGVAVDVRTREGHCACGVLDRGDRQPGSRRGWIVDCVDGDGDRLSSRSDGPVGDREVKRVGAVEVGVRRVGAGGARAGQGAVLGTSGHLVAQGVSVHIRPGEGNGARGVLVDRDRQPSCRCGRVVYCGHGDRHRLGAGGDRPVRDGVGEGIAAVVVGVWRVGAGGSGAGHRPIGGARRHLVGQGVAVDV